MQQLKESLEKKDCNGMLQNAQNENEEGIESVIV